MDVSELLAVDVTRACASSVSRIKWLHMTTTMNVINTWMMSMVDIGEALL